MNRCTLALSAGVLLALGLAAPAADKKAGSESYHIVYLGDDRPLLLRLHVLNDGKAVDAAWNACIDKIFKYLDVNEDGVLDKTEAERTPPADVLMSLGLPIGAQRGVPQPRSLMDELDADRDGKVTRDELAAYYRRSGFAPFQFGGGNYNDVVRLRAVQVAAFGGSGGPPAASAEALNDALFKLLDTNKDGKLSKEELAAAPAILAKLDVNDDEMISINELLPNAGSGNNRAANVAFSADGRLVASSGGSSPHFVLVAPGESGAALAKRLLQRYGDGKKNLTNKELRVDKETFAALDKDGDGELDAEELAGFARRPADLELTVRAGKRGDEPALTMKDRDPKAVPLAAKIIKGDRGVVALDLGVTRIDLVSTPDESMDRVRFAINVRDQYLNQFKNLDAGDKGYLTMDEANSSPFFRGVFKQMDRDGDGKLTAKEMIAYFDAIEDLQKTARTSCVALSVSDQGRGLFGLIDTDHDGRLSVRELRQMPKLIAQLDRDGDGCLSRGEIPRNFTLNVRQGPAVSVDPLAGRVVKVARFPGDEPPRPERREGPLWHRRMDRNGDGDVSRREFLGTDEEFKEIDTDGDGLISIEEAERYDRKYRKEEVKPRREERGRERRPER
jgi:Ca2+-binding EF-hand superfamily protein